MEKAELFSFYFSSKNSEKDRCEGSKPNINSFKIVDYVLLRFVSYSLVL